MGKFGGWLAGILATVIASYAVWYFTRPPATTTVEGIVYSANSAVPKAMVVITLKGSGVDNNSAHDFTDENGSYRFDFTGLPHTAKATLHASANGFHDSSPETLRSPLGPDNRRDFELSPLSTPVPPKSDTTPRPPIEKFVPRFVRKAPAQPIRIQLKP